MEFSAETIARALTAIYGKEFDIDSELEAHIFEETRRIFAQAAAEGIADSVEGGADVPGDEFLKALRESVEVFSAFRTHRMQNDIAARLTDDEGKLRTFSQFRKAVEGYTDHQNRAWLRTEYDTAVRRAHQAADWQQFEAEKDVLPNLEWIPSTSPTPGADHRVFWGTVLPVDDPFWKEHRPGDRWNCKCELRATDKDCTARPSGTAKDNPQSGLENNPGKDGHLFSDKHPYYPDSCAACQYSGNKLFALFADLAGKKDCYHCAKIDAVVGKVNSAVDVKEIFVKLPELSGAEYISQIRKLTELKIYKKVKKDILSAISSDSADYDNLLAGAKKAVRQGYKVYILPNPKGVRSADYIFERKGVYKMFDLKTITGTGSIGTRLEESIGQTNRVFLNLATTYPTNRMATEIKQYFEANNEALEVLVAVGKKMVSVERYMISERNFYKEFRKRIEQ